MAIRGDASTDILTRTTNLPTVSGFTFMAWVQINTATTYGHLCVRGASGAGDYLAYGWGNNSGPLKTFLGDWNNDWNGTTLSTATWYHLAWTKNSNAHIVYLNGVSDISQNDTVADPSTAAVRMIQRSGGTGNDFCNGRIAAVKEWSAVLTAADIVQEMRQYQPVNFASLNGWWPMVESTAANSALDFSGLGRNWTVGGTLTIEDGPPIPWKLASGKKYFLPPAAAGGFLPAWAVRKSRVIGGGII